MHSIFIGGGTPSLFSGEAYQHLLEKLREELILPEDIEITLEANPGASRVSRFHEFRQAGINRLSLGVQSWDPEKLQVLGRIHDHEQAALAVKMAKTAGFTNFNIDIMHGLPQQTCEAAMNDLEKKPSLVTPHIFHGIS